MPWLDAINGVFFWLLGLCVGSFLNVVIYRLPRGLRINQPTWSFCPGCQSRIHWCDNIPLLSWLRLRGRCRVCAMPISSQYPLVEGLTGLAFVLVFHLLALSESHSDISTFRWGWHGFLFAAWLALVASMIVCTATDLESYSIDVRVTNVAVLIGIILAGLSASPPDSGGFVTTPLAAGATAAMLAYGALLMRGEPFDGPAASDAAADAYNAPMNDALAAGDGPSSMASGASESARDHAKVDSSAAREEALIAAPPPALTSPVASDAVAAALLEPTREATAPNAAPQSPSDMTTGGAPATQPLAIRAALLMTVALAAALLIPSVPFAAPGALLLGLLVIVLAGAHTTAADDQIAAVIEEERPFARRIIVGELLWLAGPLALGIVVAAAAHYLPTIARIWEGAMLFTPLAGHAPAAGIAGALIAAGVAAAAGWALRIGFTLLLGREAFGTGDIFILAAAGATIGAELALLGLILAVGFALHGWLLSLLLKRAAMIPFGPWLLLGFLAALWQHRPARAALQVYRGHLQAAWEHRPDLLAVIGGLMLVSTGLALLLSRALRRALEPPAQAAAPISHADVPMTADAAATRTSPDVEVIPRTEATQSPIRSTARDRDTG